MNPLLVFLGGGLGAVARYAVGHLGTRLWSTSFPWSTLSVNILGSLLMGLLVGALALRGQGSLSTAHLFLATGVLGGFTTFSAFTLETMLLIERHQPWLAGAYVAASLAVGLAALAAGLALSKVLF